MFNQNELSLASSGQSLIPLYLATHRAQYLKSVPQASSKFFVRYRFMSSSRSISFKRKYPPSDRQAHTFWRKGITSLGRRAAQTCLAIAKSTFPLIEQRVESEGSVISPFIYLSL